jgi:hypothetical protein
MSLFDNKQETNFKACVEMVEAVLTDLGADPEKSRIPSDTGPAWAVMRGSAEVFVFLSSDEGDNYIQVVAPVMRPVIESVTRLYPHLLALNADDLTGAAFGLRNGEIVITTDRSTTGLDRVEVEEMIRRVGEYADHYDDALVAEYGGQRCSDV